MKNNTIDSGISQETSVHDLLKKANFYYQKGQVGVSIIYFNAVLEIEPKNPIAQHFLKLKEEQYKVELSKHESSGLQTEIIKLNAYILQRQYGNAYRLISMILKSQPDNNKLVELHTVISDKLKHELIGTIGDLSSEYLVSDKEDGGLFTDERKIHAYFQSKTALAYVLQSTSVDEIRALKIVRKLIRQGYLKACQAKQLKLNGSTNPLKSISNPKTKQADSSQDFDSLYKKATAAYIGRHYDESLELFEKCHSINSEDSRVQHNINKLLERLNK